MFDFRFISIYLLNKKHYISSWNYQSSPAFLPLRVHFWFINSFNRKIMIYYKTKIPSMPRPCLLHPHAHNTTSHPNPDQLNHPLIIKHRAGVSSNPWPIERPRPRAPGRCIYCTAIGSRRVSARPARPQRYRGSTADRQQSTSVRARALSPRRVICSVSGRPLPACIRFCARTERLEPRKSVGFARGRGFWILGASRRWSVGRQ